jgi:hypothetical protein
LRYAIVALSLAVPAAAFASSPPAAVAKQGASATPSVTARAARYDHAALKNLGLLGEVLESLAQQRSQEASPFEPPGRPPDRPPNNPGHNDPPNPPRRPLDRPPVHAGFGH